MNTTRFQKLKELGNAPGVALRIYFLAFLMLGGLAVLTTKLWSEQITNGAKWTEKLRKDGKITVRIPAVRGEIRDRNGYILALNEASYGVDLYLPQMVIGIRDRHAQADKDKPKADRWQMPTEKIEAKRDEMLKEQEIENVATLLADEIRPELEKLGVDDDLSLDFNTKHLKNHYRVLRYVPYDYLDNVSFKAVAKIAENAVDLPGVEVVQRPVRRYPYGAFAGHLLGYLGKPEDITKEPDIKSFDYYQPDMVGRSNIEKSCDTWLRGTAGKRILYRSAKGEIGGEIERISPTPGNHVYLTLDARIQTIAETTLREAKVGRAAVVVIDPNNGDILAMANVPNYDPNMFTTITEEQMRALDDDQTDPQLNRAIERYPPGSTYKMLTAFAGLRGGVSPRSSFSCNGFVEYGRKRMKCTGTHGSLDMSNAIKRSCNCYFYQMPYSIGKSPTGKSAKAGFEQLEAVGEAIGFGAKYGLPLSGEDAGFLAGPKFFASNGKADELLSGGQLANASIGQGYTEASPLQIAMLSATIANGGKCYVPRLVNRVVDHNLNDLRDAQGNLAVPVEPRLRANLLDIGLTEADIEVVRRGMWRVVNEPGGTGYRTARIKGVEVAGKTGTAQFWRRNQVGVDEKGNPIWDKEKIEDYRVWFTCFAPYSAPKFAICVMVEGGKSGGGVAAPIAQKILKESLALTVFDAQNKPDEKFVPHHMTPVVGNFEKVDSVTIKDDGTLTAAVASIADHKPGEDDERMDHDENTPVETRKRAKANIQAKPAADAAGKAKPAAKPARAPNWLERTFFRRKPATPPQR